MRYLLMAIGMTSFLVSGSDPAGQSGAAVAATRLFDSQEILDFMLEAPFEELFAKGRDDDDYAVAGRLIVGETAIPVQISTRGHTSLRESECDHPKLKISFGRVDRNAASPFAGLSSVKIGMHCGERADSDLTPRFGRLANEKAPHREAFVYRLLNALQVPTLLARPARVTYVFQNTDGPRRRLVRNAMLLEDDDHARERTGATGEIQEDRFPSARTAFAPAATARAVFAEAMIGNFDWCLLMFPGDTFRCDARHPLWNILVFTNGRDATPLIYDFDLAGMVVGRHIWFDAVFTREFAGTEAETEVIAQLQRARTLFDRQVLDNTRRSFLRRKSVAYGLLQDIDPEGRRIAQSYLDAFFAAMEIDDEFYRPVVTAAGAHLFLDAAAALPVCGAKNSAPQGTPVTILETSDGMSRVRVLDALWQWKDSCEDVRVKPVWIAANAIGTDFPRR